MAYATATLTGTYQSFDGTPAQGVIEIIPSERVVKDTAGNIILTGRVKVTLDAQGHFSVVLPATDDPTLNPTGFGYTLVAKLRTQHLAAVSFSLPGGTTQDIEDVTTVDPSTFSPTATYVESGTLATVATTGAYMDLLGQPAIPSTAADVGADPAGTAQTLIDALKAGAPAALDTLNELATALNDDQNFASTVANELAAKLNSSDLDSTTAGLVKDPATQTGGALSATFAAAAIFPRTYEVSAMTQPVDSDGAYSFTQNASAYRGGYRALAAVNQYLEYEVMLTAGKWTLTVETLKAGSGGTFQVTLDGVRVGTVDTYSASTAAGRDELPVITVTSSGAKRLRFTAITRNAASTGDTSRFSGFTLARMPDAKIPTLPIVWTRRTVDFWPFSVGTDGLIYGYAEGTSGRVFARTADGGVTIEQGHDFGGDVISGEYIIWAGRTTDGFVVITSTDVTVAGNSGRIWFGTSFTGTFTAVQAIKGTNPFSVSKPEVVDGHTCLMVGEYSTDMPQPAHVLWLSKDGGQTWANIKSAVNTDTTKNSHFHGCAVDPINRILWSSQGDNDNSYFGHASYDTPTSWTGVPIPSSHPLYQSDSQYPQPTTVGGFWSAGRLFSSPDRQLTAAVWSQAADGGKPPTLKWVAPRNEQSQNMFGRSPYAQSSDTAVVVIPDKYTGDGKVYIVGTGDSGLSWHLLETVDATSDQQGIVGPDANGLMLWRAVSTTQYGDDLLTAQMPTFTAPVE